MEKQYYSVHEFAKETGKATSTIYNHINDGTIEHVMKQDGKRQVMVVPAKELNKYKI